ncbi:MAG: hypothetical protein M1823_000283 [Watsoniomyces obsoletus]|nr:MAG: hypothetical protein M1823_000283 [Watsoniomyces obsoletus]
MALAAPQGLPLSARFRHRDYPKNDEVDRIRKDYEWAGKSIRGAANNAGKAIGACTQNVLYCADRNYNRFIDFTLKGAQGGARKVNRTFKSSYNWLRDLPEDPKAPLISRRVQNLKSIGMAAAKNAPKFDISLSSGKPSAACARQNCLRKAMKVRLFRS